MIREKFDLQLINYSFHNLKIRKELAGLVF
jgi:hypothetical protein